MLWLQYGDKLPSVALVQHALGFPPKSVDGNFGPKTKRAVWNFQKADKKLLKDGIMGPKTWKALLKAKGAHYPILDVVDSGSGDHLLMITKSWLESVGSEPYVPPPLSNALSLIAQEIKRRRAREGPLALVRIFSHGSPGRQNLSTGRGGYLPNTGEKCRPGYIQGRHQILNRDACVAKTDSGQALSWEHFDLAEKYLCPVKDCFAPIGSIELHGCFIAAPVLKNINGKQIINEVGEKLLFALALKMDHPITAVVEGSAVKASLKVALRVEEPMSSWYPWAGDLKSWAREAAVKQGLKNTPLPISRH